MGVGLGCRGGQLDAVTEGHHSAAGYVVTVLRSRGERWIVPGPGDVQIHEGETWVDAFDLEIEVVFERQIETFLERSGARGRRIGLLRRRGCRRVEQNQDQREQAQLLHG